MKIQISRRMITHGYGMVQCGSGPVRFPRAEANGLRRSPLARPLCGGALGVPDTGHPPCDGRNEQDTLEFQDPAVVVVVPFEVEAFLVQQGCSREIPLLGSFVFRFCTYFLLSAQAPRAFEVPA